MQCPACGADTRVWVRRGEQVFGPYTLAQIIDGARQGRIVSGDEVSVGNGPWRRVEAVNLAPPPTLPPARGTSSARTVRAAFWILVGGAVLAGAIAGYAWHMYSSRQVRARCAQNLRCIYLAWRASELAHGSAPEPAADWPKRLREFLPDTDQWWTCPRTGRAYVVCTRRRGRASVLAAEDPRARGRDVLAVTTGGKIVSRRGDLGCEYVAVSGFRAVGGKGRGKTQSGGCEQGRGTESGDGRDG